MLRGYSVRRSPFRRKERSPLARVLIVEDEHVLRLTFGEFFKEDGHEVSIAENYAQAVLSIERHPVDVIITDIILGGRTGVDLLRTVRERGLHVPVVMITGEPNVETASEAVRLGAFDYLPKPVTGDALKRVTRLAADRQRIACERDAYAAELDRYRRDLEAIFNSVNEGIIAVDADMRIQRVNASAIGILGIPAPAQTPPSFPAVFPDGLDAARQALEQTLKSRQPAPDTRIEFTPSGGETRVLVVSTTPLRGEGGGFSGALLMIRDVTRLTRLEQQVEESQQYRIIIGKSAKMQAIFALVKELAETDTTALILGESGTGKELVAAALHHAGPRARGPFLKVNCAALSEDLLESELFGHVKGAFTGAIRNRVGRFEAANGGTILLDEIGDISPRLQLRLLRVIQEREFERVGDSVPIRTHVRVIASTNQNLERKIRDGEFRQDLYYRLNVVRIEIPPLRERREDIPLLVEGFCRRFNRAFKKTIAGVAPDTMDLFMTYPWPGNVRELENCLERAFIVCRDAQILPSHLPLEILRHEYGKLEEKMDKSLPEPLNSPSRDAIERVLTKTDWNIAKTSRLLGIARNTLYQRIRALDIRRPERL